MFFTFYDRIKSNILQIESWRLVLFTDAFVHLMIGFLFLFPTKIVFYEKLLPYDALTLLRHIDVQLQTHGVSGDLVFVLCAFFATAMIALSATFFRISTLGSIGGVSSALLFHAVAAGVTSVYLGTGKTMGRPMSLAILFSFLGHIAAASSLYMTVPRSSRPWELWRRVHEHVA